MKASDVGPAWELENHRYGEAIKACQEELDRKLVDVFADLFEEFGIVDNKEEDDS